MRVYVYNKRQNGSLAMDNPIIVDSDNVPEGLFLADPEKTYNDSGYEMTPPEPETPELTETEKLKLRLDATENALLFLMEMGGM